jgi:uncharacterized protein (TIGR02147 family)
MKPNLLVIFEYIDFRKYLEDYYTKQRTCDPGFTHTYICFRLGQENAKSYFNNVIKGRVKVSPTFIDRFIVLLELNAEEGKYFRALVNYRQAASAHEKEFFFDELVRLNRTPHRVLDANAYAFYKEWYHTALRAVLDVMNFKGDYKTLARRLSPPITPKQARDSITLLKRLGIIAKDGGGFWKPVDKAISSGNVMKDALVEQFQLKCLEHARTVLANGTDQAHRNITLTLSLSDKAFERVSARMQQLKSEIRAIIQKDEDAASRVYHLNVNLFPMSS